MFEDYY
jgi:hypothetical protein